MGVLVTGGPPSTCRWWCRKRRADGTTVTMTVQNILDQLCPGLLALGLTLLMVRLLNKS